MAQKQKESAHFGSFITFCTNDNKLLIIGLSIWIADIIDDEYICFHNNN
nr:MAG TPA: hypothetical protein [Crassvirales sp.]